jgi:trimethylamine monooxygenase
LVGSEELVLSDGSILRDVDDIIFCTGYQTTFPFLDASLQFNYNSEAGNAGDNRSGWVCKDLFKGVFLNSNPNVMFVGMQHQMITFPMSDVQAWLCKDFILGRYAIPTEVERAEDVKARLKNLEGVMEAVKVTKDKEHITKLVVDYIDEIAKDSDYYSRTMDGKPVRNWIVDRYYENVKHRNMTRQANIMDWRDEAGFKSLYDDTISEKREVPWIKSHFKMPKL